MQHFTKDKNYLDFFSSKGSQTQHQITDLPLESRKVELRFHFSDEASKNEQSWEMGYMVF